MNTTRSAVALISGGLDSMLAAKLMLDQGIHVEGLNIFTGFCVEGHTHAIRNSDRNKQKRNNALWASEQIGIKLHMIEAIEPYKDIVINPRHGYGANLNPCLDCKGFMVGLARKWMEENSFDFIITGEVMGQRPKSQRKSTFPVVARESGAFDRLVRPLSAKLLPPTLPERAGWINRKHLLNISGRSRRKQIELAARYGIDNYSQPAGGCCFLTNAHYSAKLEDLWKSRGARDYELDDIMLLKVGRHLRPRPHFKIVIAREEGENRFLRGYRYRFTHLHPVSHEGPLAMLDGRADGDDLLLAARLVARFSQGRDAERVEVEIGVKGHAAEVVTVAPLPPSEIPADWYI